MSAVTHVTQAKAFMHSTPHIRYTDIVAYHFHVYVAPFLYLYKIRDFVDRIARRFIFCRLCVLLACLFFACSHTHHLLVLAKLTILISSINNYHYLSQYLFFAFDRSDSTTRSLSVCRLYSSALLLLLSARLCSSAPLLLLSVVLLAPPRFSRLCLRRRRPVVSDLSCVWPLSGCASATVISG